uniref:G_PROTEIN_RECEP_F1_2 domain-containing protein n=1 Tax=Steinernema glaseri TaxID=37863 RepID=A0A1I7XYW4_9BILA
MDYNQRMFYMGLTDKNHIAEPVMYSLAAIEVANVVILAVLFFLNRNLAAIEVANVVILAVLFFLNRKWRRGGDRLQTSLSHKYQIEENINAIAFVFPLSTIHCVFYMATGFLMPFLAFSQATIAGRAIAAARTEFIPLYYVVFPLLLQLRTVAKNGKDRVYPSLLRRVSAASSAKNSGQEEEDLEAGEHSLHWKLLYPSAERGKRAFRHAEEDV